MHRSFLRFSALTLLLPSILAAAAITGPSWWTSRNILVPGADEDNYAVANQGQLKHIAYSAYLEMEAEFAAEGGAGSALQSFMPQLLTDTATADDYAVATVGQVKALAIPFYQRLLAMNVIQAMPVWLNAGGSSDNYAVANIGQIKYAFSFNLNAQILDPDADTDGDGLNNGLELQWGLDPDNRDSDGDGIEDGFEDLDEDGIQNSEDGDLGQPKKLGVTIYRPESGDKL